MAKYLIVRIVLGEHHSIPNMGIALVKNAGLGTANLVKVHLVNGLNGPNVQYFLTKENNNAKGNVLVQEIVLDIVKMKEIVRIYQVAKERLVNGQIGQNILLLVKDFEDVHGNALVLENVKAW